MAIKRLYVPRRRYDEIVSGLEATLSRLVVGSGLGGVTMGPLNTRRQRDYPVELLDEARAWGTDVMSVPS
jgi:phenylacetaldehyde dehydrogenase